MIRLSFFFILLFSTLYSDGRINYLRDIKPVLERRCTVCHSCYNSPCQLKLDSYEGVDRGGTKQVVYLGTRLETQEPTRLFIDAQTTAQWRQKKFFGVTGPMSDRNISIMGRLLDLKQMYPQAKGEYRPEADDLMCAENVREIERYIDKHPNGGMPFGFPALNRKEHRLLMQWLAEGAHGPEPKEQERLTSPSAKAAVQIEEWERFLNRNDPKFIMTARYLYDHLFLAHIHFDGTPEREFYEIVRSKTPSPKPIEIIPTVRPYDDPGVERVYYRFRKIHSTIVHKTHMIFPMSHNSLNRIRELFITTKWLEKPNVVPYGTFSGANPFLMYAQIPPKVRYQFMLDHSHYIVDTFIRGPVCKGQIALNVIEDHFWVFFLNPDFDLSVRYPGFLLSEHDNLRLPTEKGSGGQIWNAFSDEYRDRYAAFYKDKIRFYSREYPEGLPIEAIWKGETSEDTPALSVYRHFDSASVHAGVLGDLPKTLWVIDYPQFERIYYALVAGFDVFGNVTHQTNVRRYMDYLRMEGEMNFLQFLPMESRYPILQSWYIGDEIKHVRFKEIGNVLPTKITYMSADPKRELVEQLVERHFPKKIGIGFDSLNYFKAGEPIPTPPKRYENVADMLQGLRSLHAPGTAFIRQFNEYGVDVLMLRVHNLPNGENAYFSIVINRWHDNVNALFLERIRLNPAKDTMEFFTRSVGSYPNYFFDIDFSEFGDFVELMNSYDGSQRYREQILRYGINRSDERFWPLYDDFQSHFDQNEPMESGLYDLNRYYYRAL